MQPLDHELRRQQRQPLDRHDLLVSRLSRPARHLLSNLLSELFRLPLGKLLTGDDRRDDRHGRLSTSSRTYPVDDVAHSPPDALRWRSLRLTAQAVVDTDQYRHQVGHQLADGLAVLPEAPM